MRTVRRLMPQARTAVAAKANADHPTAVRRLGEAGRFAANQRKIGEADSHRHRKGATGEALAILAMTRVNAERRGMYAIADSATNTAATHRKSGLRRLRWFTRLHWIPA